MRKNYRFLIPAMLAGAMLLPAASLPPATGAPRTFATPQEAIQAAIDAAEKNDTPALLQLVGVAGKDIVQSGDPRQDQADRADFVRAAHEKLKVDEASSNPDRVTFTVGNDDWPFPVPVVRTNGKWQFDAAGGRVEILARRIGQNELNTMDVIRGYAEAQLAYATVPHDGSRVLGYAFKVTSTTGKHDGLYTPGGADNLVPKEFAEATFSSATPQGQLKPYHGYYFRILQAQGPQAPGGALSYVVAQKVPQKVMMGGFALVAWPAQYGVSGIRTFLINHDGVVFEKDLGAGTGLQARQMTRFNPDNTWRRVTQE